MGISYPRHFVGISFPLNDLRMKQVGLSRATLEFSFEFSFWSDQSLVGILTNLHTYTFADLDTYILA